MTNGIYRYNRKSGALTRSAKIIIAIVILLIFFWGVAYISNQFKSVIDESNNKEVYFAVRPEDKTKDIAQKLEAAGLIKDKFYFSLYLSFKNTGEGIKADLYKLSPSMSTKEIAKKLLQGESITDNKITIIEGWTMDKIASAYADFKINFAKSDRKKNDLENEFISEVSKVENYDYDFLENIPQGNNLEGFLFPDTYKLYIDATPADLINKMLINFDKKLTSDLRKQIKNSDRSIYNVIILASIVQKEVKTKEEMEKVAGVYYNRLKANQALGSDVTINYITGKNTPQPSYDDVKTESPYNTYKNKGLPPGPIGNPGLVAIESTVNYTEHDYFYFLTRLDTGEAIFSKTGTEHLENKRKYLD